MAEKVDVVEPAAGSDGEGRRERAVTEAFVAIANSLVDGYDIVELYSGLTRDCAAVLDIDAAGLLLVDREGVLQVAGASSEAAHSLELLVLQCQEGPCLDCFTSGVAVSADDLGLAATRWPRFAPAALAAGITSVHALPMRLRGTMLGALGLFAGRVGALTASDLMLGQALAHVASVALVAERASVDQGLLNGQLQAALDSRVVLEQAKGIIAHGGGLDMEAAFAVLRGYARDHNLRLSDTASGVIARTLRVEVLLDHGRARGLLPG